MELNEIETCYFAALIDGLRLINERIEEDRIDPKDVVLDGDALIHYTRIKGDRLVALHLGLRANPDAVVVWPTSEPLTPFLNKKWARGIA